MQKETGAMQEIIAMQCGKFYNKKSQMIMLLLQANSIQLKNSLI